MKAANSWSSTTRIFFLLLLINKHSKEKLGLPGFRTISAILNYDGKRAKAFSSPCSEKYPNLPVCGHDQGRVRVQRSKNTRQVKKGSRNKEGAGSLPQGHLMGHWLRW